MSRHTALTIGTTLIVAVAVGLLARFAPLSISNQIAVPLLHATDTLLLTSEQGFQQKFQAETGWHSGVVIYATAPFLGDRQLLVRILNDQGQEIARGSSVSSSYSRQDGDTLRLQISTSWFKAHPQEKMLADIHLVAGPPLPLRVITEIPGRRDVALRILEPLPFSPAAQKGVLAGLIAMLGTLLMIIGVPKHWHWPAAGILLVLVTIVGLTGFWYSPDRLGIADWDYYFSLHNSYRQTILQHHQLPLWNPTICGGTSGIGDPEFPVFTPTFLLELIFGIPRGLRLAIYFSVITGGLGMLAFTKRLGISVWGGLIAALVFMFSTVNLLEIVEGHVNIFAAMWLSWLWWSWLGAYQRPTRWRVLLLSLFFALLFMQAGIYLLVYSLLTLAIVILIVPKKIRALTITGAAGLGAMGLVAIKLIPVLFWLHQFPQQTFVTSTFTLSRVVDILFGRYLPPAYIFFRQGSDWHEYGAYIGYIIFALSLLGLTQIKKRPVIALITLIGGVAVLLSSLGPAFESIYDFLWFIPRSNMSRIILLAVSSLAVLAGFGLDALQQRVKSQLIPILFIGFVAIDLLSLAYPAALLAFVLPPVYPAPAPPPAPIAYTANTFDYGARDTHQTRTYEATKVGWGSLFHCSVLGPKPAIIPVESENDSRVLTAEAPAATIQVQKWSPNQLTATVESQTATRVTANTNYAKGWQVNNRPAEIVDNRPATTVPAGQTTLHFVYRPPGFRLGLIISLLTLLLTIPLLLFRKH